jgi:hypothetical protein
MPSASRSFAQPKSANRTPYVIIGLLALAVLALGAVVVNGQLAQRAGKNESGKLVQAAGSGAGGPLLQVPGEAGKPQPLVEKPVAPPENAPVPADVLDYLAWLKRIESKKRGLINTHNSKLETIVASMPGDWLKRLMEDLGNDSPLVSDSVNPKTMMDESARLIDAVSNDWNAVAVEFNQRTPPSSCRELHARYYEQLNVAGQQFVKVLTTLSRAFSGQQTDIRSAHSDLVGMKGAGAQVDEAMRNADNALSEVCRAFRINKDFDIGEDRRSSSGMLGGFFGGM